MSGSNSAERKRYEPLVLVETADLSEEDWLDYRRRGIGGSDVSAIFGTSPFRTARDLYYDKLNIASVEDDEGNWVAMEMGHLLEPLVAKIFERKTGYRVYQIKKMFQHPQYPWMLADVDYFVELPDGTTAILEIKTTNYNARDNWWMNGKETVPVYYESQGRHYMAVTDLDRCFFCCLYGNNEEEVIIREVKRDFEYEAEMVFLEQYFWENHVQRHVPPPYTESGALIIESARKHFGPADKNAPAVALDLDMTAKLMQYLRLLDEKKNAEVYSKEIDKDIQRLKALLIAEMGTSCTAICEQEGVNYTVTYTPVRKSIIDKDMNNRTMATVYVDRDSISLKTRSRNGCSPQQFIILKKELQRLEEKKYLIAKDIHSYAELRLCDAVDGVKVLEFSFTWLKDAGRDSVSGYTERIRLPYEPFRAYAAGEEETVDGTRWRLLSIPEQNRPKLEFHSRKNLKAVVENPILRHKLGKFLDQHFNWYNYERIVLTDDYLPYSFFFEGYMVQGAKTCGGVILHGEENIQTAKYGIHT